ncbi:RNase adapter RapZ [Polymorphobacter sp.]|uniref:RNase adapter RapZ n=1 Tax=Polymorphobacter sp. TaxID=1909290 RepID=UPI003F70066F
MTEDESIPSPSLPLLAISGMSGAGRSTALKALEDLGYEVVDNLPLALVDTLITAAPGVESGAARPFAFGIDSRTRGFDAALLVERLRTLRDSGHDIRLVYLDCSDDQLVRRFSETRRRHPLAIDRPVADGIARERELTAPLRRWADLVFDTSDLSVSDLRRRIAEQLGQSAESRLTISLASFGFANGLPRNADLVFDMRFLANPHWDAALRPLTGEDPRVVAHIEADPAYSPALDRIVDLLVTLIPGYIREGKAYLAIAIGCTGGRHRSVAVARALQQRLADAGHGALLSHRDLNRAGSDAAGLAAAPDATTTDTH